MARSCNGPFPRGIPQSNSTLELTEEVYAELRRGAAYYLKTERPDHTLQPTALVHEAWIRMGAGKDLLFRYQAPFFAFAAEIMLHVLVDHGGVLPTSRPTHECRHWRMKSLKPQSAGLRLKKHWISNRRASCDATQDLEG